MVTKALAAGRTSGQIIGTRIRNVTTIAWPVTPRMVVATRLPVGPLESVACSNILVSLLRVFRHTSLRPVGSGVSMLRGAFKNQPAYKSIDTALHREVPIMEECNFPTG